MIKRFHELSIEAFIQATEDESRVMEAIENLLRRDLDEVQVFDSKGIHGNPIKIVKTAIRREREIIDIISLWKELDFWKEALKEADERLDENLVFHVRVDKQSAYENDPRIWMEGESIKIRLKVASFPASRERALEVLGDI